MIQFYHNVKKTIEVEKVYGDGFITFLYQNKFGKKLTENIFVGKGVSRMMGSYYSSRLSRSKIPKFISQYNIDMSEYEDTDYNTFNDFFIRKFKSGKREFNFNKEILSAPCEARYFGYSSIAQDVRYPVKGEELTPEKILGNIAVSKDFLGGTLIIARLCPVDYHRYHYPCDAVIDDYYLVPGILHSVNPKALREYPDIFSVNERNVTLFLSDVFGKVAYVEVGAMGVGKIIQSQSVTKNSKFKKGDEKGYFLFGASTVILLFQKNHCEINKTLQEYSKKGIEVYYKLGEDIAVPH